MSGSKDVSRYMLPFASKCERNMVTQPGKGEWVQRRDLSVEKCFFDPGSLSTSRWSKMCGTNFNKDDIEVL